MIERMQKSELRIQNKKNSVPTVLLLPGSRRSELQRHLPAMLGALKLIQEKLPAAKAKIVLPNQSLLQLAKSLGADLEIQIGELPRALARRNAHSIVTVPVEAMATSRRPTPTAVHRSEFPNPRRVILPIATAIDLVKLFSLSPLAIFPDQFHAPSIAANAVAIHCVGRLATKELSGQNSCTPGPNFCIRSIIDVRQTSMLYLGACAAHTILSRTRKCSGADRNRADKLARDYDLLLSIFPFEKEWYAQRVPQLRVEFVGHPMIERMQKSELRIQNKSSVPTVLLLPGSRRSELQRHLQAMLGALKLIQEKLPAAKAKIVLPNQSLLQLAKSLGADLEIQIGELPWALAEADVAIASTGTVTMECAFFGVPTVTLYKTSWLTYQIGKRLITVKSLTMPNLLAGETVYPEFIQNDATPENLSGAALELLQDGSRREKIKAQLAKIISSLGEPGAAGRAAKAVLSLK